MSPASRGRKSKKAGQPALFAVDSQAEECACPSCSGEDVEHLGMVEDVVARGEALLEVEEPLEAELSGALFVSASERGSEAGLNFLLDELVPALEETGAAGALAMLRAIASVAGEDAEAVSAAADRVGASGLAEPRWAAALREPVQAVDFRMMTEPDGVDLVLACSFRRAGSSDAFLMTVDMVDCGAAVLLHLLDGERLREALEALRIGGLTQGIEYTEHELDPAEFRWQAEVALDARAVHDENLTLEQLAENEPDDGESLPFDLLATLLRTRLAALPVSSRPKPPHVDEYDFDGSEELTVFTAPDLPGKRKKSDGPAPVYQLKVGLRGVKPPIWRRLEVPADFSLAEVHDVIQVAFGWDDCHLHVFSTENGEFGIVDLDGDDFPDSEVSLEQVLTGVGGKLRYTYDFGDHWEHEILVEKVLDREAGLSYPRCTGGRRGAPPEDCGGIHGYADLIEILADPAHPEHEDRLEWLGLADASAFDPTAFDAEQVTAALYRLG